MVNGVNLLVIKIKHFFNIDWPLLQIKVFSVAWPLEMLVEEPRYGPTSLLS